MASNSGNSHRSAPLVPKGELPRPGQTYIIRDPTSGRQITLVGGILRLEHHLGDQGGYHWECIEENGWLGFRNPVGHLHIGCNADQPAHYYNRPDTLGFLIATAQSHGNNECLTTTGGPGGGQLLLFRLGKMLVQLGIDRETDELILAKKGTEWDFILVPKPPQKAA
ncbi:hypothetical protein GGS26DRAFT_591365 [Hypomontagnella submonticulosa]|nr:hypothetical protein GGS26DRAFT_591365 [Hypomontagnella submonticulosa]